MEGEVAGGEETRQGEGKEEDGSIEARGESVRDSWCWRRGEGEEKLG